MKKLIYISIALLSLWSCAQFDDSKIWDEFKNYYDRLEKVEAACDLMNSNISALQAIVTALQGNDYVTGVAEIVEDGEVVGYTITFSKSGVVKIYHGEDGANGADGAPGADGRPGADGVAGPDGVDGENGHSPVVGVRKDVDGVYYWTIDGEWMLDDEGQKVPATGKDGADASAGSDGKDGVTPLLKIEDGYWFVSYDGGSNWTKLYKAVGENGADGATGVPGQDGADGKDGADGDSFFQSVDTSSSENYIILTLSDGTQIKLPTWKAFEELQTMVNKLNTNLSALQTIVEALQNNDYVTSINPITEDGIEIGYTIDFSKSKSITVYHGKDGADGSDGEPGQNGEDGKDGKDGYTPVLGVKAADDDWSLDSNWNEDSEGQTRYYWTLDGEWLLDSNGNRIPATGANGAAGADGAAGLDGTTPKLKIVDGYWYVSLDGGQTWQPEPLGPATAGAGESIFTDIFYDNAYLYITLSNGEQIRILRHRESLNDYCQIDSVDVKGRNVRITGHLNIYEDDIAYTQISLYYSNEDITEEFNIFNANRINISKFDYNRNFSITLKSLEYETKYCYCVGIKVRGDETYSPIYEFTTGNNREDVFNFAETKWMNRRIIHDETGELAGGTDNVISCLDYIPVIGNTSYSMTLAGVVKKISWHAWYDAELNYISVTRTYQSVLQAPEAAAYLRITLSAYAGWFTKGEQVIDSEGHLTNPDASKINLIALPDDDSDNPKGKYLFYEDHSDLIFNSFLGSQYFYFSGASIVSSLNEKTVNGAWCMLSKECVGSCTITAYLVDLSNSTPPNWQEIGSTIISNLPAGTHIEFDIPETIVPENHTIGFRASKAIIATVIGRDSTIAKQETSYYDTAESTTPKKLTTASYDIRLK